MEHRLSEAEKAIISINGTLGRFDDRFGHIEGHLDRIAGDVSQFKWFLLGAVLSIWLAVWGMGIAIQQMTVASFQAAGEQARAQAPAATAAPQPIVIQLPPQAAAPPAPAASR